MSSWLAVAAPALVALVLLYVPGLLIALAARLRGLVAVAAAPLASVAVIAVSAVIWGVLRVPWGLPAVLLTTLAVLVVGAAANLAARDGGWRIPRIDLRARAGLLTALAAAVAVSAVTFLIQYVRPVGAASNYGQLQDTMFHFNVVQWILDTGIGSSTQTGLVDGSAGPSHFYPSAWHDTVALVVSLTGAAIPVAVSALTLIISVLVLPLGLAGLARVLFGPAPLAIGVTAALSGMLGAFPWRFLSFGVLYSNHFAMAALAGLLALVVQLTGRRGRPNAGLWLPLAMVPLLLAGLALAQPNTLFGVAVYLLPLAVALIWRWTVGIAPAGRRRRVFAGWLTALAAAVVVAWGVVYNLPFLQRTVTWVWPPFETTPRAIGEALLNGYNENPGQPVITALIVLGAIRAIRRRRHIWMLVSYALFAGLYVLAASVDSVFRDVLTGFWYHDSYRLAAFASLAAIPIAALGALQLVEWVQPVWNRIPASRLRPAWIASSVVVGAVLVLNIASPGMISQRRALHAAFDPVGGWMLDQEETSFLADVRQKVPDGDVIANNPYDGSGLAYAFDGSNVLFTAMDGNWLGTWEKNHAIVAKGLSHLAADPAVCAAAKALNIRYLVQLNPHLYSENGYNPHWAGLRVTPRTPGFALVASDATSALYRLTECAGDAPVTPVPGTALPD